MPRPEEIREREFRKELLSLLQRLADKIEAIHPNQETDDRQTGQPLPIELLSELRLPIAIGKYYEAEQRERDSRRKRFRNVLEIFGIPMTLGMVVLTFFTLKQIQKQTALSEDTAKRQLRANVLYESSSIEVSKDGRAYTVSIKARNFGQSPAYNVTSWVTSRVTDPLPDPYKSYLNSPEFTMEDTSTESTDLGQGVALSISKDFPIDDFSAATKNKVIYVWGQIQYRDQFQRCQYDLFRLQSRRIVSGAPLELVSIANAATDPDAPCDAPGHRKAIAKWDHQ